jgi:hypothetical protein
VLIIDGPYLETKEHIGGFWILEAADMDEALARGRKGAVGSPNRKSISIRPERQFLRERIRQLK